MGAISITAALVVPSAAAQIRNAVAGATITQGQILYILTADSKAYLADANGGGEAMTPVGIALSGASAGQKVYYAISDPALTIGATLAAADTLWLYSTAGAITITPADVIAGFYGVTLGVMTTTLLCNFKITQGGLKV